MCFKNSTIAFPSTLLLNHLLYPFSFQRIEVFSELLNARQEGFLCSFVFFSTCLLFGCDSGFILHSYFPFFFSFSLYISLLFPLILSPLFIFSLSFFHYFLPLYIFFHFSSYLFFSSSIPSSLFVSLFFSRLLCSVSISSHTFFPFSFSPAIPSLTVSSFLTPSFLHP